MRNPLRDTPWPRTLSIYLRGTARRPIRYFFSFYVGRRRSITRRQLQANYFYLQLLLLATAVVTAATTVTWRHLAPIAMPHSDG